MLHVNRSIFDETTFAQYKNNAGVSYPSILDLGKWCLGTQTSGSQKLDLDPKTEEWPRDPKKSMLVGADTTTPSPFQYRLRAAVTHFGTHGNGHYVCYRPHPRLVRKAKEEDKDAEEADDKDADEANDKDVEEAEAQKEGPETVNEKVEAEDEEEEEEPSTLSEEQWWRFSDDTVYAISEEEAHQGNVFMLFYERIDDSTPSTKEANAATETLAVAKDAPLPPANVLLPVEQAEEAVAVPLPGSDDIEEFVPPEASATHPAPPVVESDRAPAEDAEASETEVESEAEVAALPTPTVPQLSPNTMRTAGNAPARGQGSRASLPLVSAT